MKILESVLERSFLFVVVVELVFSGQFSAATVFSGQFLAAMIFGAIFEREFFSLGAFRWMEG